MMTFSLSKAWYVQSQNAGIYKSAIDALAQETLTADAIENFLREKKIPLRVENGGIYSVLLQEMQEGLNLSLDSRDLVA